jgi:hypothetical protein
MNRDILENSMGYSGFEYISDALLHTAPINQVFVTIQCITDTVIAALKSEALITGNTFTGVVLPAGTIILTRLNNITLTSGSVIAYKGI